VVLKWRGHVENVTCMVLVEDHGGLLVTSSLDCTVRVWTLAGHYVGTMNSPIVAYLLSLPYTFLHLPIQRHFLSPL